MKDKAAAALVPGSMSEHSLCLLLKFGRIAFRQTEDRLAGLGLRVRHYSVLQALVDIGATPQTKLGKYLGIDAATMVACIDSLEQMGLVERLKDDVDRRRYQIAITAPGEHMLVRANESIASAEDASLADISSEQRHALLDALQALNVAPSFARNKR